MLFNFFMFFAKFIFVCGLQRVKTTFLGIGIMHIELKNLIITNNTIH